MAANIKGLTVEIGGDTTKLGKALEDVNKKSRDLSSELYQIEKALKLDPGNVELLAQKQSVLAEAVETTRSKLDKLKTAEKQVQEQFQRGEVSEDQVRALQREIITTSSKLTNYETQAREAADQIDKLGSESEESKKDVDKLGDEAKNAGDQLDDAGDKASTFGEKAKAAGAVAAAGFAAVATAAGAAVGALAGATVEAAAYADDMLTMSTVTGMSTDDLQAFSYAAGLLDVEVETISKSLAKNTKSMASAADGSTAYADAYDKLGVSVTDANGNLRDSETVYWEAIDALGQMENETERDAVAMQLFGKSAQELNPLIEAGSEAVNGLKEEAKEVGAVMSEDTLAALGSFDDSIQRLQGSAGAAKNSLGGVLLPELQMLTDAGTGLLTDFTQKLNASGGGLEGLVATVGGMSGQITGVLTDMATQLLNGISTVLPTLATVAVQLVTSLATSVISMLPQLITTGIQVALALIQGLTQAIPQVIAALVAMIPQLVNALVTGIPQLIQGAVQLLLAIVDAIPQIIPPLVAALPQIVLSIVQALAAAIPQLIMGAVQFLLAIIDAIPQIIPPLIAALPEIIVTIINALLDATPLLLTASIDLLMAVVKSVPKMIVSLVQVLPQIWEAMKNFFSQLPGKLWTILTQLVQKIVECGTQLRTKGKEAAKKLLDAVVDGLKNLPKKVADIGKNLITGLWKGIKEKITWLKDKLSGFAGEVLGGLKDLFGINSPSKETAWLGEMLDAGLAAGVTDNASDPIKAMRRVSAGVLDAANGVGGLSFDRQLARSSGPAAVAAASTAANASLLAKLDGIYERLGRLQVVLDTGTLVGETLEKIDSGLASRQLLSARGV